MRQLAKLEDADLHKPVQTSLVGLTEEYGKTSTRQRAHHLEQLQSCVKNIEALFKSWSGMSILLILDLQPTLQRWTGLLYLCADDFRAIKSVISSLHLPVPEVRVSWLGSVPARTDLITESGCSARSGLLRAANQNT